MKKIIKQNVRNNSLTNKPPWCLARTGRKRRLTRTFWSEWMRDERIPVYYRDVNLDVQFTSVSAYLQAYMLPNDHRASEAFTAADVQYLGSVACMVAALSKLWLLLRNA